MRRFTTRAAVVVAMVCGVAQWAAGAQYTVSYLDGGNWQTLFAQGFNSSLGATPNPGLANGTPVYLKKFEFFKSGTADTAANIRLVILNGMFPNNPTVTNTTSTSPTVVGLSTNTLASTAAIATGDPVGFDFNNLPLSFGTDYAAVFVNVGTDVGNGAPLTPIRVSALAANYVNTGVDTGGGLFHPATNYGTESQFNYATSNSISGGFFQTFSYAGDANFRATINTVPEPIAVTLMLCGIAFTLTTSRRIRM